MDIKKEYIKQAIKEWEMVEKAMKDLQGHNFNYVCDKIYDIIPRIANYDGELFDFETSRILGTIYKEKGRKSRLDKGFMFDISEDLSGEWIDTSIDELRKVVE